MKKRCLAHTINKYTHYIVTYQCVVLNPACVALPDALLSDPKVPSCERILFRKLMISNICDSHEQIIVVTQVIDWCQVVL